jgi:collagen type IV alpha
VCGCSYRSDGTGLAGRAAILCAPPRPTRQVALPGSLGRGGGGAPRAPPPPAHPLPPPAQPAAGASPASPPPGAALKRRGAPPDSPLDTLLPGFASRPNPSPKTARRLGGGGGRGAGGGAGGASGWVADVAAATVTADPALAQGDVGGCDAGAAAGVGGGFLALPEDASASAAGGGGGSGAQHAPDGLAALGLGAPRRALQGRTLLQQHLLSTAAEAAGKVRGAALPVTLIKQPAPGPLQPAPATAPAGSAPEPAGPGPALRRRRTNAAATAADKMWSDLAAELQGGDASPPPEAAPARAAARAGRRARPGPVEPLQPGEGAATDSAPPAPRPVPASAPRDTGGPPPLDLRLHRGELSAAEAAALDALPLPSAMRRLQRIFEALAAWQGFLTRQLAPVTWANSAAHVEGLLPHVSGGILGGGVLGCSLLRPLSCQSPAHVTARISPPQLIPPRTTRARPTCC